MSTKQPINYLDFNNPIHIIWRKGTPDDPFVDRLDITRVVNQRVALLEIPDELYRVRIANMFEINYERFIKSSLAKNEFYCDYTNGFVYFHSSKEAETVSIVYKGRGVLLYPSNRIVHYDGTDTVTSLHEIIETSKLQVKELISQTENFEEVLERMIIATNLTNDATNQSINATQESLKATELVKDAYNTTVLIYQPYVKSYDDILTTYPNPLVGWTVQTYDTGIRYRWNGQEWIPIDLLGANIPLASEDYNGLMSKEQFLKLEDISKDTDYRTIVFICPQNVIHGIQDPHVVFPFDGEIMEAKAFISQKGELETEVNIEKSKDFETWKSILDKPLMIEAQKHKNNDTHTIVDKAVKNGDVFRLNIPSLALDTYNLTVNITIKID